MALIDNLVSWWTLDEFSNGSGAVTREDSHSSNDLTDNNTTPSATGIISLGADFESTNSEYLSITDAAQTGLDITGDFSISCWIKLESAYGVDTQSGIVNKGGQGGGDGNGYGLFGANLGGTSYVRFYTVNGGTLDIHNFTQTLSTATWYNIIGRFRSSDKAFDVAVNAVDKTQQTGTVNPGNSSNGFAIGASNAGSGGNFFDGIIDEVGIWNRRLTDAEIDELYNSGAGITYSDFATVGPSNLKTYNTNLKANIKTMNTNPIANVKTFNTNA